MAMSKKMLDQEPSEIEMLLPWHAAGTLNARDARRVDEALARDPELARQYAVIREEYAETIRSTKASVRRRRAPCRSCSRRSTREPARKPSVSLNLSARIAEFFASLSPRTLAWSASLGALALLLQAGVIGAVLVKNQTASFQTASLSIERSPSPATRCARCRRARWCGSRRTRASPTSPRCSTAIRPRSSTAPRAACSGCSSATGDGQGRSRQPDEQAAE